MILTPDNYYSVEANREYMSCSQYQSFMDCEARTMAELEGRYVREDSDAFSPIFFSPLILIFVAGAHPKTIHAMLAVDISVNIVYIICLCNFRAAVAASAYYGRKIRLS